MKRNNTKLIIFIILALLLVFALIFTIKLSKSEYNNDGGTDAAIVNYKQEVVQYANIYKIPSSYLMALIMLECSGRKFVTPRYEKYVFYKLRKFRDKKISKFEDLQYSDIENCTDKDLKILSKSYGPFQIMGYKSIKLGVNISDLDGKNAIEIGIKWINNEYGDMLRDGRFKDAFHTHNTGKIYPKSGQSETYDPQYVENGMYYIRYFSSLM